MVLNSLGHKKNRKAFYKGFSGSFSGLLNPNLVRCGTRLWCVPI